MFVDARELLDANPARAVGGLAMVDVDGSGEFALFVAGFRCANRLLRWSNGRLVDTADARLADPQSPATCAAAADLDRDGKEEIYVVTCDVAGGAKTTADRLFRRDSNGWRDLMDEPRNETARNRLAARGVAAVDRRGGGRYGFLLATHGGPLRLFELDPMGQLVDRAPDAQVDELTGGSGIVVAPLLSGSPDLVAVNAVGPSFLFRPTADGRFCERAAEAGLEEPGAAAVTACVIDANGDGRLDLVVARRGAKHRLWVQTQSGAFVDGAPGCLADPSEARGVVVADFDNDGYEEIFFHNSNEPNRLFGWREGGWRPLEAGAALQPHRAAGSALAADLDGDGVLELALAHGDGETGMTVLRHKAPAENGWLRILPRTATGAPARGAKVTLEAGRRIQTRVIDAGGGAQGEPVAHFGLGAVETVERVTVRWADGTEVEIEPTRLRQTIEVPHPAKVHHDAAKRVRY